ncbi:MAG: rhodanese-like domain-containing protein [Microbacteriaceae bacterium]
MAEEISVSDLALQIETGAWVLDVREDHEFEDGHVPQAHHIPLGVVPDRYLEIPQDEKILVICKSGRRSQVAADFLISKGFSAVSVVGGTDGWIESGREVSFDDSL